MVSTLKVLVKYINGAFPRMQIMEAQGWGHVGKLFQWSYCCSMSTVVAADI